jgi:hypothetical protein
MYAGGFLQETSMKNKLMTRAAVATELGLTVSGVQYLLLTHQLKPRAMADISPDRILYLFDRDDVERLRAERAAA